MRTRPLGSSGFDVSAVGLGCNNFGSRLDAAATRAVVHKALDLGITMFDTADAYGPDGKSELCLGEALGPRRKDVVLATKFGLDITGNHKLAGAKPAYVMTAAEASLKRMRTDWIDLYQIHYPDPATPIDETLRALDDLVRQGKVRRIGYSNASAANIDAAVAAAKQHRLTPFISNQDQYSLLSRGIEREIIPAMAAHGLGLLPYFPLASGMLTGKYRGGARPEGARLSYSKRHIERFVSDGNWSKVDALTAFAEARGRTVLELAFAWLLAKPIIGGVIAGASTADQVEANVRAAAEWPLSPDDLAEIDRITL